MHATSLPPAGKGVLLESKPDGEWVRSKVVEPTAIRLVDEGVYTGYSVGIARPRIDRDPRARGGRIVGGKIVELSLVDRPANPMAKFVALKMAGGTLAYAGEVTGSKPARKKANKAAVVGDPTGLPIRRVRAQKVRRYHAGMHVTVHAKNEFGQPEAYEGRVVQKGYGSLKLDRSGFSEAGATVKDFSLGDVTAVYKGSVPLLAKNGSEPEGGPHHSSTEVSVAVNSKPTDDQKPSDPDGDGDDDAQEGAGEGDADKVAAGKCGKCSGTGKIDGATCDTCGGSGNAPTVTKGADHPAPDGSTSMLDADSDQTPRDAKGQVSPQKKPKKKFPFMKVEQSPDGNGFILVEKGKTLATHTTLEAAEAQKQAILDERKLQKSAEWLLRRAHDFTCGVYKAEDVAAAYPGSYREILGPATRRALTKALSAAIKKDAGRGKQADNIRYLSGSLAALNDIIAAEKRKKVDKVFRSAREELHGAFKIGNMGLSEADDGSLPKPAQSVTPGQFRRGYLSAGHQREKGGNPSPSIPTTTHPVDASDFRRGPLTDGHQRYLASKLADFHDGLSYWKPGLCLMDAQGSNAFDRQPFGAFQRGISTQTIDNRQTTTMHPVDPGHTAKAPGEKGTGADNGVPSPDSFKFNMPSQPGVSELTEAQLLAVLSQAAPAFAQKFSKIEELEATVAELSRQPDPNRSAHRGVTGGNGGRVEKVSRANQVQQSAARSRKAERIDFYKSLARSGDPEQRIRAQERLARWGVDALD